jgi:hypothetical protein
MLAPTGATGTWTPIGTTVTAGIVYVILYPDVLHCIQYAGLLADHPVQQ